MKQERGVSWAFEAGNPTYIRKQVRRLNYFIKDEEKTIKKYNKAGYVGLARDEAKHLAFLQKLRMEYKDL